MHAHFTSKNYKKKLGRTKTQSQLFMHQPPTLHPVQTKNFFIDFLPFLAGEAQENNDENVIDHSHEKQSQLEGHQRLSRGGEPQVTSFSYLTGVIYHKFKYTRPASPPSPLRFILTKLNHFLMTRR